MHQAMLFPPLAVTALVLHLASVAFATTADDVCPPAADPCVVPQGTGIAVTSGSVLDFGTRALVLSGGSGTRLDVGSGSMTIIAGSVTLNPGSGLLGRSGTIIVTTTGDVAVLRSGTSSARIDVSDFVLPGSITVDAGGAIEVGGIVTARGTGVASGSGTIALIAGEDVTVSGTLEAQGGGDDIGGDVIVQAPFGNVVLSGVVDVTGGSGGSIDILAGESIATIAAAGARFDVKATGPEGDGGSLDLATTNGDVDVVIPTFAQGTDGVDFGGSGGYVTIDAAAGSVALLAPIDLSGAAPDGDGGDLDVSAALDITQTGLVTAIGKTQSGFGGAIDLFSERTLVGGPINVEGTCKTCTGGDVTMWAWCEVRVPAGVTINALGGAGTVLVESGGPLIVKGTIRSGNAVDLFYRSAATPPDIAGAVIVPAPRLQLVPALIPCGGPPGINCGNSVIDLNETCDDGNKTPCDGCSAICLVESCGDGFVGCDELGQAEACDDANNQDCDGCRADCSRRDEVCGDGIIECGEACDTGSAIDCDTGACSATCRPEACQNGRVECAEECDDGQPTASCNDQCVLIAPPSCGNGATELGEACDDGNTVDCDGCSSLCQVEACGNGNIECAEECDDFNTSLCDGCSPTCRNEECGNEIVDCGEECDEGAQNGQPGSTCLAETCTDGVLCTEGGPIPCIPCAAALDCDPAGRCAGVGCVDGECRADPLDCVSTDACLTGTCDAEAGCVTVGFTGFASVRCRTGDLEAMLASDGIDGIARTSLAKLLSMVAAKVNAAEAGNVAGSRGKTKKGFNAARTKLLKMKKKVFKLQPGHITDPAVGSALDGKTDDAIERLDQLRGELGV